MLLYGASIATRNYCDTLERRAMPEKPPCCCYSWCCRGTSAECGAVLQRGFKFGGMCATIAGILLFPALVGDAAKVVSERSVWKGGVRILPQCSFRALVSRRSP